MKPEVEMIPSNARISRRFSWRAAVRARQAALPPEHGAWVFLLSPLAIGLAVGGFRPASLLLTAAALAVFLVRQPVTLLVKALSGRRPKSELAYAVFWLVIYGLLAVAAAGWLLALGYGFLLWLALPALPVFAWHLWLVRRRAERRQMLVEILASGVLALAAPAAYWVGQGQVNFTGWLLWALAWLHVAGTILYAYLRLEQRSWKQRPSLIKSIAAARAALWYHLAVFVLVAALAAGRYVPPLLPLAFLVQPLEVLWGTWHPAVGVKPKAIGIRQLVLTVLFALVFIVAWA
jgi:nitrate reductase NapE component